MLHQVPAYLPSPDQSVWFLGPIPIRAYALCILIGIAVAMWVGARRYAERGGDPEVIADLAIWIVPFGVIGGRLYHVITSWQLYFGPDGNPSEIPLIWHGGLGIWGAVAMGSLGGWIGARRLGVRLAPVADALAPGVVLAQGIGRIGNWFNNELYGSVTTLPWGLKVHQWDERAGHALTDAAGNPLFVPGLRHPTFLYELLWDVAVFFVLIWADRRFRLWQGQVFWLYVALYTVGRFWIEMLRTDEANLVLGLRLNVWTSLIVFSSAVWFFVRSRRRWGARTGETGLERTGLERTG